MPFGQRLSSSQKCADVVFVGLQAATDQQFCSKHMWPLVVTRATVCKGKKVVYDKKCFFLVQIISIFNPTQVSLISNPNQEMLGFSHFVVKC